MRYSFGRTRFRFMFPLSTVSSLMTAVWYTILTLADMDLNPAADLSTRASTVCKSCAGGAACLAAYAAAQKNPTAIKERILLSREDATKAGEDTASTAGRSAGPPDRFVEQVLAVRSPKITFDDVVADIAQRPLSVYRRPGSRQRCARDISGDQMSAAQVLLFQNDRKRVSLFARRTTSAPCA
jgi:hypothetical protein